MTQESFTAKKLYEVNQYVKNHPYYFDMVDQHFVSHDGQSDIMVSAAGLHIETKEVKNRFVYVEDGKLLFKFLDSQKKLGTQAKKEAKERAKQQAVAEGRKLAKGEGDEPDPVCVLTQQGFLCNGETFPVVFTDEVNLPLLSDQPKTSLKKLDCSKASLHYQGEVLKEEDVSINDIIDVIVHKKTQVDNLFIFMEIINNEIHLFESKLGLSMNHKTLICLDNFQPLKSKKAETQEYLHMHIGTHRLYVSYGNSEYDFVYKFNLFDLSSINKVTG
jgi:hypothetical protein